MEHKHPVFDTDTHFTIDPITRQIKNASHKKTTLMQFDHNSERFTFECPRYIEAHDMSECNKVEVHYLNIDGNRQNSGVYVVDDFQVMDGDETQVTCSWVISSNATQLAGTLSFLLRFLCVDGDIITYSWNTDMFTAQKVSKGIDASGAFETEYADVIEQWKASVMAYFAGDLKAWKDKTLAEIHEDVTADIASLAHHATPYLYGAVGDGVTDDTDAVKRALSAEEVVYFPKGKYLITSAVDIPEGKTVILEGEIVSLGGKSFADFAGTDVAIVEYDGSDTAFTVADGSQLRGGLIYAPNAATVVALDVGTRTLKNVVITSAILGERTEGSTAVCFRGSSGTTGSLCFSKFASAIHGFEFGYFVDRPSGQLPWFTFCDFSGVLSENYKAFTHNLTSYGNAFGSSYYRFTVCGGYKWKNTDSALLELIGDNVTIDCKFSDVGVGRNHVYGLDISHVQKSTVHNIPYQSPLFISPSRNRNNFTFGELGTVENANGTLSYAVNGNTAHVFYTGNIPNGSTYIAAPFACLVYAKTTNGNVSIETQQHFPNIILKNSASSTAENVNLSLMTVIH